MFILLEVRELKKNIYYSSFVDEKFKFNTIVVNFIVNLNEESAAKNAILSSLMQQSCKEYSNNLKIGEKLRSLYGADLFCDVKKVGSMCVVYFGIVVLDDEFALNNEELTFEAFKFLKDIIFHTKLEIGGFSEKELNVERENILDLLRSIYGDKREFAIREAKKELFKGKSLSVDVYGSVESIKNVDVSCLKSAYEDLIFKSKVYIFYGGRKSYDVTVDYFLKDFLNYSNFERLDVSSEKYFLECEKEKVQTDNVVQAKLVLGFAAKENSEAVNAFNDVLIFVMNALFGGTPTSLLFNNVREKLSLCYYCRSVYDSFSGVIWVESGVEMKNIEKAKESILNQLDILKRGEFTEHELQQTIFMLESGLKNVCDSTQKIALYSLNNFLKDINITPNENIDLIKKVTKRDIKKVAKKFFLAISYVLQAKE